MARTRLNYKPKRGTNVWPYSSLPDRRTATIVHVRGSPDATQDMAFKRQNPTATELALKYGSISVRTLREFYGSFAPHCADGEKLSEVLAGSINRVSSNLEDG